MDVRVAIGVGAQSTLGQDIVARKYMYEKLTNAKICPKNSPIFFGGEGGGTCYANSYAYAGRHYDKMVIK